MQVVYTLGLVNVTLEPAPASNNVHNPVHVLGPVVEKQQGDGISMATIFNDQNESKKEEKIAGIHHADVVPAPTAVMSNELESSLVHHFVLLFHDMILLTEGTNNSGSTHAFVEVTVDGAPKRAADFVKLAVSVGKEWHNFAEYQTNNCKADESLREANREHETSDNHNVRHHIKDMLKRVEQMVAENVNLFLEDF